MMRKRILIYQVWLILGSFYGCFGHEEYRSGSFDTIREERMISGFSTVTNYGPYSIRIIQDSVSKVVIEGEKETINTVKTTVKNQNLSIIPENRYCCLRKKNISVFVHIPVLKELDIWGSGNILSDKVNSQDVILKIMGSGDIHIDTLISKNLVTSIAGSGNIMVKGRFSNVSATISGSGDIKMSGVAVQEDFRINGSGSVHAGDLLAEICFAKINGSGDIYINAARRLECRIWGSGDMYYKGYPEITLDAQGSGHVTKMDN